MVQDVDSLDGSQDGVRPVFVAGALRSGSTLLRLMLNAHPQVVNPGEFDFLFDCIGADGTLPEPEAYRHWLSTNRIFQATHLELDASLGFVDQVRDLVAQVSREGALTALSIHRHFDKVPLVFPDARFIHLLRDPRDVARSSIGMGWAGHVYHGVNHWIDTERSWDKLVRDLDPSRWIEVRYEDLVRKPRETLERIFAFLRVPYDETALRYMEDSSYAAPDPGLAEQWRRKQTKRELMLVEGKLGDLLTEKGYEPSGFGPRHPALAERMYLLFLNRWARFRFAVKRYGASLVVRELVSRRLGLEAWWRRSRMEMNAIDKMHLK